MAVGKAWGWQWTVWGPYQPEKHSPRSFLNVLYTNNIKNKLLNEVMFCVPALCWGLSDFLQRCQHVKITQNSVALRLLLFYG